MACHVGPKLADLHTFSMQAEEVSRRQAGVVQGFCWQGWKEETLSARSGLQTQRKSWQSFSFFGAGTNASPGEASASSWAGKGSSASYWCTSAIMASRSRGRRQEGLSQLLRANQEIHSVVTKTQKEHRQSTCFFGRKHGFLGSGWQSRPTPGRQEPKHLIMRADGPTRADKGKPLKSLVITMENRWADTGRHADPGPASVVPEAGRHRPTPGRQGPKAENKRTFCRHLLSFVFKPKKCQLGS